MSEKNLHILHKRTPKVYENNAKLWDQQRPRVLFEQLWLDKFLSTLPANGSVLDVGCGAGVPISEYCLSKGFQLSGLDISAAMLTIAKSRFPAANWIAMDMRDLQLESTFDGIISWDGFFHLTQQEQRQTLGLFAKHLNPKGSLMLTIGHEEGEVTGTVAGEQVYHASLAPEEYRTILTSLGFKEVEMVLQDPEWEFHSILLATAKD
ncbi:class I SAM-dependent methyltransferase [uncultured Paraglaciecola sp.]|uniref:class I SAM-dependent DNA methyltransferase n=1 Tax=uncultured Paraglaciecola sp. TaxID=1765024 RepID=UPI002615A392|nr:class I SAM-dependent methyltransferase [uncultured Paraglaciecola sp.]